MNRPALISLALTVAAFGAVGRGQDDAVPPPVHLPPEGSQLFRALLDFAGVKPVDERSKTVDNNNTIVIVFGRPRTPIQAQSIQQDVRFALTHSGSALIATDQRSDIPDYLPNATGEVYVYPAEVNDPIKGLNGLNDCPAVSPGPAISLRRGIVDPGMNPFSGLNNVTTNRPGVLFTSRNRPVSIFSQYYQSATVVTRGTRNLVQTHDTAFAAGQDLNYSTPSRWIALADEGVLTNEMLAAKGTDNFVFAFQLVNWLRSPHGRPQCLFYEYGKRIDKFDDVKFVTVPDLPGPPMPQLPPFRTIEEQITDFGNKVVDEVQSDDKIHRKLVGNEVGYARWLRNVAVLAAVVAAFYLLRRAFAARQSFPGPIAMPQDDGPPGKLLAVLRQEMVRGNNFTPAVTAYIEETFRIAGLPDGPHPAMPPVAISGKKVKHKELMADIARLWGVVYGPGDRPPIHYAAWRDLEPAAENARRLAVKGRWRFLPPGGAA